MNKIVKILLYLFIFCSSIISIYFLEEKFGISLIYNKENNYIDRIITNTTWGITGKNTAYKKGDDIEYIYVISREKNSRSKIDISDLENKIDISEVELNDKKISKSDLSNIFLNKDSFIRIKGKAKKNSDNQKDIEIKITSLEEYKDIEKKEENISTGRISFDIKNTEFNSNIDNILEISGTNLDQIEFVNIGGISLKPVYKDKHIFLLINKNTFGNVENFILFKTRNGKIITSDKKIKFTYNDKKINVSNINPSVVKNDIPRYITLQGNGFSKVISIQLSNNLILRNTEFTIVNDQVLLVKVPAGLQSGEYTINIMDTTNIYEINYMKFLITN